MPHLLYRCTAYAWRQVPEMNTGNAEVWDLLLYSDLIGGYARTYHVLTPSTSSFPARHAVPRSQHASL
jgi:hypothetical protein